MSYAVLEGPRGDHGMIWSTLMILSSYPGEQMCVLEGQYGFHKVAIAKNASLVGIKLGTTVYHILAVIGALFVCSASLFLRPGLILYSDVTLCKFTFR